jgi:hypothetical protein
MPLQAGVFLSPLGLAALAALVPLVVVYLLRPDPRRLRVPTVRFLDAESEAEGRSSALKRLRRNLLFVLQAVVIVLLALSLATPYVQTSGAAGGETVIVVDTSASMAAGDGDSRFDRAVAAATEEVTGRTTVVTAGPTPEVVLRDGSAEQAREALSTLSVTDAPGDLRSAITRASTAAAPGDRIVVASDFADRSDWQAAVELARARNRTVELRQFDRGGTDNVGIVDLSFDTTAVTVTVANTGTEPASRELRLGEQRRPVELEPGDIATRSFELPAGGGTVRLTPGDSFAVDDTARVVAPDATRVDVLLLTNGDNRFVRTALRVLPGVELTVKRPPAAVTERYDVFVFGDVSPEELLRGTVGSAETTLERGGGVVVQSQPDVGRLGLGELLLAEPGPARNASTARVVAEDRLVEGISFPTPSQQVGGQLRRGQALVNTSEGVPLVARASVRGGQVLQYGYPPDDATFGFAARYPVFWKRAVLELSGRPRLSELNRATGERATFDAGTVAAPDGSRSGPTVPLTQAGVYRAGDRRVSASLQSIEESTLDAPAVDTAAGETGGGERRRPLELTPLTAGLALVLAVSELGYLRARGDL